ncbi:MAG: sulfatase-like hydrolase/transferase [Chloroflexi bacterium]|nr:sulfatase-like hydrolase/transferase [Chloroflexota bacterium]
MPARPNILWLMTDEQRADSLGFLGAPWARTPHLDRLARSGTCFAQAYTPSPVCIPARGCLLTGRAGSSIGVLNNHHILAPDDPQFLTWRLAAAGYQVATFGKQHYACQRRAFDLEGGQVLGDLVGYYEYKTPVDPQEAGVVRYDGGRSPWLFAGRYPGGADETPEMANVRAAQDWLRGRDPARPFLLRVSFNAPHTPVVTPAPYDTLIDPGDIDLPLDGPQMAYASATHREYLCDYAGSHRLTPEQIRRARQCYYGQVAFVDHAFGRLLEALGAMGSLENTVIAYVSDHGCHLGDHGFFQKQSFWEASARVPFFLAGPGIESSVVRTPVSAGSLLPTLLELAGAEPPAGVQYPSLAAACRGAAVAPAPVFSEVDYGLWFYRSGERYVMVRDGRWKLCLYRDPRDPRRCAGREDAVLYDLERDPGERENLAAQPAHAETVGRLVGLIDGWDRGRPIVPAQANAAHGKASRPAEASKG